MIKIMGKECTIPVSIIMRSKDEMPYVQQAMKNLRTQTYPYFNLYNIDSGSKDGTWETVQRYNVDSERIVQISPGDYVPGRVLNQMVEMTSDPIVVFLNSDAIPTHDQWLENLIRPILEGRVDATMGRQIARPSAYFIVQYDYERAYPNQGNVKHDDYFFSAVSCAFRRELWIETKFYEDGFSEDCVWCKECKEKGFAFQYVSDAVVEHSHNYTLPQLYRRKRIEAEADVLMYRQKPNIVKQVLSCGKELMRDFLYAGSKLQLHTVPYNIAYRVVAHIGLHHGKKIGVERHCFNGMRYVSRSSSKGENE